MKLLLQAQNAFNPLSILAKRNQGHIVKKQQKILCKCNYINLLSTSTKRCKRLFSSGT